ncbi:MAG: pyridoxal-5'-phosphate-dependent protein subunit beta [Myxococcales bacterium]|nr:pyridoxal-5'-phosphate-dependent protein subunit beta [Myxococcales bacterium]
MAHLGLARDVVDRQVYQRTVERFREKGIRLPKLSELAEPGRIDPAIREALAGVGPDEPHPLNLFRVHWYNDASRRGQQAVPAHLVLPRDVTGVAAPIVVLLGDRFPMIAAHKVLAAYGCLAPRVVTGQFDPTSHRAIWPSTGNYCRGGVAVSRIMDCRGVAVLPEMMSQERFDWLDQWVIDPSDIVRTPGSESNVKEIYDACNALDENPENVIFNQFSEFGNHLVHYLCTGMAAEAAIEHVGAANPKLKPFAYVSATGSAGTLAAGDYLKDRYGAKIVAVEATECPTLLANGFGEHNIQGIGDKHLPLIHNAMNTDVVVGISDQHTDGLFYLFNHPAGRAFLAERKRWPASVLEGLRHLGFSSLCNILAAIKVARHFDLDEDDLLCTVATDGAAMYGSEMAKIAGRQFPDGFDTVDAAETFGHYLRGLNDDHLLDMTHADRTRTFNLGYFTWVEQQGIALADFEARRQQSYWRELRQYIPLWDEAIERFNRETGL